MQKFLVSLVLTMISCGLFSQSIDDIKDLINKQLWDKAKTAVDAFLLKDKNASDWEGWWHKGVIYNEIAKSDPFKGLVQDGRMEAFNAFKKYYELEPKAMQATLEQHVRLFDIYSGYFDMSSKFFTEKKYDEAYNNFKNAYTVEEYIASKGFEYNNFKFPAFDTTLIQNIALSAYMAKKEEEAVVYYKKIADLKIAGKENLDVYQLMVEFYNKKNDIINREKYLKLGSELYPEEDYWYQIELADVEEKDAKAVFAKYEELCLKYPGKKLLFYNYAVELFNYAYTGDKKPADYKEVQKKIESTLKHTLSLDNSTTDANLILARHYYNVSYDLQDEMIAIKGNTPADQKSKTDLKAMVTLNTDELIKYGEITFQDYNSREASLKTKDKGNFKLVTDLLLSAFEIKGDKNKIDFYKKKLESLK